jgi:hypothetical protein
MLYGTPQKSCLFSVFVVPSFLCIKCPSKIVPCLEMRVVPCYTNCCPFVAVRTIKSVLYDLHKTVVSFSRNLCTKICCTALKKSVQYDPHTQQYPPRFLCYSVVLGIVLLLCKCCLLKLDLSLLLSQQEDEKTTQESVRPLALVDLMREGEGFFNLTVEIRLDGWLRFGVSSLTLTLVIKSPFNLHLTN